MSTKTAWWDRLNRTLFPYLGPPPLGPGPRGEHASVDPVLAHCPICGQPMAAHQIERTADWSTPTRIHCPAAAA